MEDIRLEILGLSTNQAQSGSFALILGEANGHRKLPIIIGMFEAQAIAIEIEHIKPNRPMTHDLIKSFADAAGVTILTVKITHLKEGVFFAKLECEQGGKIFEIDARPSDAIAIAVRFNAPIFTTQSVMEEAGISLTEFDGEEDLTKKSSDAVTEAPDPTPSATQSNSLKNLPLGQLKKQLDAALAREDYELAAKIRDEINNRES